MTGPDSAGRPNISAEELARYRRRLPDVGASNSAKDVNRIQRIAVKESRLGIPVVFATDIIHGYWTVFPVPLGLAATFDAADARAVAKISGLEGYSHGQRWTFAPMVDHPVGSALGPRRRNLRRIAAGVERLRRRDDRGISPLAGRRCPATPAPAGFRRRELPQALPGLWRVAGRQGLRVRRSVRTRDPRVPPAAVRGRRRGRRALGDAGVHHRSGRRADVRQQAPCSRTCCAASSGSTACWSPTTPAITEMRNHGTAADDLEAAVQALRDGTMTVDMEDGVYYAQLARAVSAGRVRVDADRSRGAARARVQTQARAVRKPVRARGPREARAPVGRASRRRARDRAQVHRAAEERRRPAAARERAAHPRHRPARRCARRTCSGPGTRAAKPKDAVSVLAGIARARRGGDATVTRSTHAEGVGLDAQRQRPSRATTRASRGRRGRARTAISSSPWSANASRMSGEAKNRAHLDLPGNQQALVDALVATRQTRGRRAAHRPRARRAGAGRKIRRAGARLLPRHRRRPRASPTCCSATTTPAASNRSPGRAASASCRFITTIHRTAGPTFPSAATTRRTGSMSPDEPLFAFGFGLSYTQVRAGRARIAAARRTRGHASRSACAWPTLGSRRRRSRRSCMRVRASPARSPASD